MTQVSTSIIQFRILPGDEELVVAGIERERLQALEVLKGRLTSDFTDTR